MAKYKFTNAYRASDRVSQYLIRFILYEGDQSPEEVFFRAILFKLFNRIETWEQLKGLLGHIAYADFDFEAYDGALLEVSAKGPIYSAAYIMPSGKSTFGHDRKYRNHLTLISHLMEDRVYDRVRNAKSLASAFEILKSYPTLGDFLAYQLTIDLNYSTLLNWSENQFVVPGPGARDGIAKCFADLGGLNDADIIRRIADLQDEAFTSLGIRFKNLWGRPLHLIDCQNLFCEVGKYARVRHPEIQGHSGRTRIKQRFVESGTLPELWFPPKWGMNDAIAAWYCRLAADRGPNGTQ